MPADKDAAKRRRQARNRQERQNRQARTEGAKRAATRPSRTPEETPTRAKGGAAKTSLAKGPAPAPAASGGFLGKLFPPRPAPAAEGEGEGTDGRPARTAGRQPRPPSEVVEVEGVSGPRGLLITLTAQPGGRAAVLALLVALVAGVTLLVAPIAPPPVLASYGALVTVQADGGDATDADAVSEAVDDYQDPRNEDIVLAGYDVSLFDLVGPGAIVYAAVPVVLAGLAVRALTRPTRSRTLTICAGAGALYVFFLQDIGFYFILGVFALGYAAYQSSKADRAAVAASS